MENKKTPYELIYEFCKEKGICIGCKLRFVEGENVRCEKCRAYHNKNQLRSKGRLPDLLKH